MSGSTRVTKQTVGKKLAKPAWATTEFGAAVFGLATALVTLLGVFSVDSSIGDAIMKAAALVAAGGVVFGYGHARAKTKAALGALVADDDGHGSLEVILGAVLIFAGIAVALIAGKALVVFLGVAVGVIGLVVLLISAAGTFRSVR